MPTRWFAHPLGAATCALALLLSPLAVHAQGAPPAKGAPAAKGRRFDGRPGPGERREHLVQHQHRPLGV